MHFLNGYYFVGREIVESKVHALVQASEKRTDVKWWYYNEIFDNANENFRLHDASVEAMYKQRALQLRDSYDYLILNYSGGADSHNILATFLKNNIRLDHIFVQWPERLMDRGLYVPNSVDKSNANFHSEWDLVLKKDLEWLGKNHPEIKIEIADWTMTVSDKFYSDDIFANTVSNLPSIARAQKQHTFSPTEGKLALAGKKVASIFGVDKPQVTFADDKWFMSFVDTACMAGANPDNPNGTEYFYITPMMPELAILQAHKVAEWYIAHPEKLYLVRNKKFRFRNEAGYNQMTHQQHYAEYDEIAEIVKQVCYPDWDFNKFQAAKPFSQLDNLQMGVRAWDNILTVLPTFNRTQQAWEYHWKSYLDKINPRFMRSRDTVAVCRSRYYELNLNSPGPLSKLSIES
jgi:hypothetical protein